MVNRLMGTFCQMTPFLKTMGSCFRCIKQTPNREMDGVVDETASVAEIKVTIVIASFLDIIRSTRCAGGLPSLHGGFFFSKKTFMWASI